jgi:hypothetical protein
MAGTIVADRIESDATYNSKIELVSPVLVSNTFAVKSTGGTGVFNIVGANTNTDRTFTLPNAAGEMVLNSATQTLTNKTIQGGALTRATAVASTSGTSVDFTGIPSWVKRITVMFSGVSTNGTSALVVRLGDAGGIETTGYVSTSGAINLSGMPSAASATSGFVLRDSSSAAFAYNGQLVISNLSGNIFTCSGLFSADGSGAGSIVMGSKTLSDTLDRVRITTANGTDTFDAGTINIMYEG